MSVEDSNAANDKALIEMCDQCGPSVRAMDRVVKGEQELFLCRHHYNIHETALVASGWAKYVPITEMPLADATVDELAPV